MSMNINMNKRNHYGAGGYKMVDKNNGEEYLLTVEYDEYAESPIEWDNVSTMVCWHRRYNLGDKHNYANPYGFFKDIVYRYVSEHDVEEYIVDGKSKYCKIDSNILYGRLDPGSDWYEVGDYDKGILIEEMAEEDIRYLAMHCDNIVIMPINMYEHSGITISTSNSYPYNDRWDSGCVGFAYITKDKAMQELVSYVLDDNGERIKIEHKRDGMPSTWSYKTEKLNDDTWKNRAKEIIDNEVEVYDYFLSGETYRFTLEKKVHYRNEETCPHCGEVINVDEYDDYEEVDSCCGFYGSCLEENGIMDYVANLEFVD